MSEIQITGDFAVPEGDQFKLIPCQGVEIKDVHNYLESIYNHSFKNMHIRHVITDQSDYLIIDKVDIINMAEYIKFEDTFRNSEYGKLFVGN